MTIVHPVWLFDGPDPANADHILLLAHGAGAPMDSEFLSIMADQLSKSGITVARFEFAYMAGRRSGAGKRPPPKMEVLCREYETALTIARSLAPKGKIFIGGKSMGGRVATMIAAQCFAAGSIKGCVCLGYPFHPPGKPENLRTDHLVALNCPTLIVQGERDRLGDKTSVQALQLSSSIELTWRADGNHDFAPRRRAGLTHRDNMLAAANSAASFIRRHSG